MVLSSSEDMFSSLPLSPTLPAHTLLQHHHRPAETKNYPVHAQCVHAQSLSHVQ